MFAKTLLSVLVLAVLGYFVGIWIIAEQFEKDVERLFLSADPAKPGRFQLTQLSGLPLPVANYFRHVLRQGQPYINSVKMIHDGQFKTDLNKGWIRIRGTEYFSAPTPGFVWKGVTSLFTARDMYICGQGRLVVSLLSLFTIQDVKGENYNEGELLRWLGESVIFPTNLLPDKNLRWLAVDSASALMQYHYNGIFLEYKVIFNNKHEISEMRTLRHMGNGIRQQWVNKLSEYQKINGVLIPTVLEAGWMLKEGYFPYAKFRLKQIEYNKTSKLTGHPEKIHEQVSIIDF
jgi:hypothetical protein